MKLTDVEYIKEVLKRSSFVYMEKEATADTDHKLILGFDKEGRQIFGIVR